VRNWFVFAASERWRADDSEHEHYSDSGGKSGGQKEKLAYTVPAASLAYQFGLELGAVRSRSFRFVVIDEAFGRGSDESPHAAQVFITENETNFLAFPDVPNSVVIFGAGYGWDALAAAHWLRRCTLFCWGDIDTHGFAILDQLRGRFEHVESLLMNRATLLAHEAVWGAERDQVVHDLPRLTNWRRSSDVPGRPQR
jgi:hypothetical protein